MAESWRRRWDSFCLVLPNWTIRLAGRAYIGPEPDGFMPREEIVEYLSDYAASFGAPVVEGVSVASVSKGGDGFVLATCSGEIRARQVVVATGGYRAARAPEAVSALASAGLVVVAAGDYRSPADLPDGRVLVVGSGQTGCQLAEELRDGGREVWLACGRAPWQPRRVAGLGPPTFTGHAFGQRPRRREAAHHRVQTYS